MNDREAAALADRIVAECGPAITALAWLDRMAAVVVHVLTSRASLAGLPISAVLALTRSKLSTARRDDGRSHIHVERWIEEPWRDYDVDVREYDA